MDVIALQVKRPYLLNCSIGLVWTADLGESRNHRRQDGCSASVVREPAEKKHARLQLSISNPSVHAFLRSLSPFRHFLRNATKASISSPRRPWRPPEIFCRSSFFASRFPGASLQSKRPTFGMARKASASPPSGTSGAQQQQYHEARSLGCVVSFFNLSLRRRRWDRGVRARPLRPPPAWTLEPRPSNRAQPLGAGVLGGGCEREVGSA